MTVRPESIVVACARAAEAGVTLLVVMMALRVLPFRWIARHLGGMRPHGQLTHRGDAGRPSTVASRVALAVERAARRGIWEPRCLERAIAGFVMLRHRGIAATIQFGVAGGGGVRAHAWLEHEGTILLGAREAPNFQPIASLAKGAATRI